MEKLTTKGLSLRVGQKGSFFVGWVPKKEVELVLDFVGVATGVEAAMGHWGGIKGFCEFNGMKELGGGVGGEGRVVLRVGEEDEERALEGVEEVRPFSLKKRITVEVVR